MLKKLKIFLYVALLHMPAPAWSETDIESNSAALGKTVYFPQFQLFQTVKDETDMLYEISGKLVLRDECLRIATGRGEYLLIWPGWYDFDVTGREIAVKHLQAGSRVARLTIGANVRFSGAELENHPINLQYAIPDQCPGPYWAVGEIESVKSGNPFKRFGYEANKKNSKPASRHNTLINNNQPKKTEEEPKNSNKGLINLEIEIENSLLR